MSAKYRFGAYELDVAGMELRKSGVRIRLQDQPFRILVTLVERPGEVVTREELRVRLWANDTFVDFDQSLNKAINRLREVLNDDASHPRYIETIPRRGYRFIAPVTDLNPPQQVPAVSTSDRAKTLSHSRRITSITIAAIATLVLLIILANIHWAKTSGRVASEAPRIIVPNAWFPAISRDGTLLAYASTIPADQPHMWVRQMAGHKAIQVTKVPFRDSDPEFSPDGTQILFSSERDPPGVYAAPTFSGEAKLVVANASVPRFSPDGQKLLCWSIEGRVVIASVTEAAPLHTQIINPEFQTDAAPLWSPSSSDVMFYGRLHRQPATFNHWWILSLRGGGPRRIDMPSPDQASQMQGNVHSWIPAQHGKDFIMYSVQQHDTWSLFRITASARGEPVGQREQLLTGQGSLGRVASLSNDGKVIYT